MFGPWLSLLADPLKKNQGIFFFGGGNEPADRNRMD
jgi:hypothetical protein